MRKVHYVLIILMLPLFAIGQNRVSQQITSLRTSGAEFEPVELVRYQTSDLNSRQVDGLAAGTILSIDQQAIAQLQASGRSTISLALPVSGSESIILDLVEQTILTPGFQLFESANPDVPVAYTPGKYYRGMVRGAANSVASLSVFNDELMAIVSNKSGNLVLGKLKGDRENLHILYNDEDLQRTPDWECEMPDDDAPFDMERIKNLQEDRDPGDCVKLYIEIDDDIVSQKGGAVPATNYMTGLFNEVIVLYANDQIDMALNEIFAWSTPAPYSGSSSSAMLSSYQANTGSFNGDLSHLVSYQASGGIAAGFSGICNSNPDNSKCFSSIDASFAQVPTYSWSVMVTTHEMGHLIGSRHTHACVWNGNNTAIDGCSGQTEGSCPLPGFPSNGGTIMSYCHLQSVGINLSNGFGPQPGAVVRGSVNGSGNCLTTCGGPPPPPPPPAYCAATGTNQQYEWIQGVSVGNITNTSGSNGGYGDFTSITTDLTAGNSYTATLTPGFASGAYTEAWSVWIDYNGDLDFNDAGEQVGSGSGSGVVSISFTVPSDNAELSTRMRVAMQYNAAPPVCGSFTYGEVEDYTVNITGGAAPTCTDGVQNGNETGVDCGGPDCPACPTCTDGVQNGDETGVDCGGADCPACPTCTDGVQNGNETGVDCGGPDCPACPTCNDGVQNGDETGVDCGGPDCAECPSSCDDGVQNGDETGVDCGGSCPACPTSTVLFAHFFESGWDGWADGGSDCYRYNGSRSWEGTRSIRIRDNSGIASSMTSSPYNVSGASSMAIEFYFYVYSMETNEDFFVRYFDGSQWNTVAQFISGSSFSGNGFYTATVTLTNAQVNFASNAQFRFQCDASGNQDQIYIDAVTVTLDPAGALIEPGQTIAKVGDAPLFDTESALASDRNLEELTLYPNPTSDMLNIGFNGDISAVKVMTLQGVEVYSRVGDANLREINVSGLPSGLYIVLVESAGEWVPKKFIKN